jgi:WD40 repeat protein
MNSVLQRKYGNAAPSGERSQEAKMKWSVFWRRSHLLPLVGLLLAAASAGACIQPVRPEPLVTPIPLPPGMDTFQYLVALAPDGKTVAVAKAEGQAELWSLTTGQRKLLPNPAEVKALWELAFSKSGRLVAAASEQGITIWDIAAAKITAHIPVEGIGHLEFVDGDRTIVALAIPKGYVPLGRAVDPEIVRFDVASGKRTSSRALGLFDLPDCVAPGRRFAAIENERTWKLYDVAKHANVADLGGGASVAFSEDGSTFVSCGPNGVSVLEMPSGKARKRFSINPPFIGGYSPDLSVSFDGKLLAAGRYPFVNSAGLISLETGEVMGTIECGPDMAICRLALLSPDGSTLATLTSGVDTKDQPARPVFKLWKIAAKPVRLATLDF